MRGTFRKPRFYLPVAFSLALVFTLLCALPSCDTIAGSAGIEEGVIHYEVSYPYYDGLMEEMLPDEMTLTFREGEYVTELSSGDMFKTRFIADCQTMVLDHTLKFMNSKSVVNLDEAGTESMLRTLPPFTIVHTNERDSVAGFLCNKAIGVFDDISQQDMVIYYTTEISIENVNWCNQFAAIDGVLLAYETEQFGLRTRYEATLVEEKKVEDDCFATDEDYVKVTAEQMHVKLANLFSNL